ncbi:hypothetical protein [Methanosarcina barkeri]|uniref:hypothetical protein n=1 Tax=Methanosarcina barkeri TaxID=2208 RepID=UPI000A9653F1|nr:hypothetical protein [Methanosarcina barkeri]
MCEGNRLTTKKAKKEASEVTKNGLSTFLGKISGKGQLELEIDKLNSQIAKLELDLQSAKNQLEKKKFSQGRRFRTGRTLRLF